MNKELLKLFKQNKGYLLSKQLIGTNLRYHLNKMLKTNEVSKIHYGLYVLNNFPKYDDREIVANLVPNGVFCMFSAWEFYNLTTTIPYQYHIAIDRKARLNLPDYPPVKLYYWNKEICKLGITQVDVNGKKLVYYNLERSVCDAAKHRNKIGMDIFTEVLKAYFSRKDRNIDLLMKYASQMRVKKIITPYLQSLL